MKKYSKQRYYSEIEVFEIVDKLGKYPTMMHMAIRAVDRYLRRRSVRSFSDTYTELDSEKCPEYLLRTSGKNQKLKVSFLELNRINIRYSETFESGETGAVKSCELEIILNSTTMPVKPLKDKLIAIIEKVCRNAYS